MSCVPARALFHTAPRCVEIRELPTPRPAAGEVLVRTVCSGISGGTERLVYRGEVPADMALDDTIDALGGTFSYPFAYGYACVGEVAGASGGSLPRASEVAGGSGGSLPRASEVAGGSGGSLPRASTVESGQMVFAFHPHQDVFAARASDLIALPAIDPASATLFPLVETALQVTLDAGTGYRDRVIVLGAGVLGLLTGLLLQRSGWRPLIAEPQEDRKSVASSLGVTTAAPEELVNEEVPLVIDASGNPDVPAAALDMLAHEGTLLVASWFGTKPVVLPLGGAFHRRRLVIRSTQVSTVPARLSGTWTRCRRRRESVELMAELPLPQLCTHVFAFGHAAEAFRAVDEGMPGLMHAVLDYDRSAAGDL